MKCKALFLWFGLALLPLTVQADQTSASSCVNALEQLATLHALAPVYKLSGAYQRQYLADADRPAEVARLKTVVTESCSAKPRLKKREQSEVQQLHLARSPACMQDRDRLAMMERTGARTPEEDLARTRNRVVAKCPDVDLTDVWLIEWIPTPSSP